MITAEKTSLANKRIGIDVSAEAAHAEVTRLEEQLRRLGATHPNVAVRADTAAARAALAEFRAEIDAVTADPFRIRVETDGAFGAKLRAAVREAEASLPNINIDADTSPAQAEIATLRAQLTELRDARVGIDLDAGEALARINEIQARLARLSASDADVAVRVDAAAAQARLALVQRQVNDLDRDDVNIRVRANTGEATSALLQLAIAMGVVAAIPAVPALAAGLGAVAAAATAAGAGLGAMALVAIPSIKTITDVMQLQSAAADEAAHATTNNAAANVRGAQRALQMASAQQALTAAHRNAARSIAQANRQVADAERAVAQAAQRAADQRRQAAESIERAERSLVEAKKSARQAEESLTLARKDAAQQLADLDDKLIDGKLSQRDATLRVQEAEEQLYRTRELNGVGKASDLDLERAQLSYDQAVQAQSEQSKSFTKLQQDAKDAKKAGIDGNKDVRKAAEDLAKAQQNVRDQTEAVAKAHADAARAAADAAQSIVDAQQRVTDAVENAANAHVTAAESIKSAERGVESARLSSIDTTTSAISKSEELRKALADLTPEQRDLYDSIAGPKGLKKAFKDWAETLAPDVLPIFTAGVESAKNTLPGLTPLVKNSTTAVKELQDAASAEVKTPFWQSFKSDIADSAEPAIVGLGTAIGNVLKGMAGIVDAFLPHMEGISETMQRITKRFANWGANLKGSPEFERFIPEP
ncbi:hypothetical protein [Streptomyces sp. NPDC087317]|uniref:hypothetical protein n=1 Tax=Streptomyces sp. NPDC087317 TaxID=3365784 RepID=UPI00381B68C3